MQKTDVIYKAYINILNEELVVAMGCTEPIAIAYAASKAKDILGDKPDRVEIHVSNNIIKNVKSVVVPNTKGLKGIQAAAVAGIIAGNTEKKLEVISEVTDLQKDEMKDFLENIAISVDALDSNVIFDIIVILYKGINYAKVRISQHHTNIVYVEKNGEILYKSPLYDQMELGITSNTVEEGLSDKTLLNFKDILDFAETLDIVDIEEVIKRQIDYNTAISEAGLKENYGANIGSTLIKIYGNDIKNRAVAKAAAGSDARMSGCELPVVINSGSGNQGITVSVPVIEYAYEIGVSKDKLYRALVISNLISIHEKEGIGRLSAYCGAVTAGCAAACGIAYLYGGGYKELAHTLVNSVAIVSGIICDGAKPSCAAKIASSVESGILGYHMYMNGQQFRAGDGIVNKDVETTIKNVGRLGKDGMKETDKEIVKIMIDKC